MLLKKESSASLPPAPLSPLHPHIRSRSGSAEFRNEFFLQLTVVEGKELKAVDGDGELSKAAPPFPFPSGARYCCDLLTADSEPLFRIGQSSHNSVFIGKNDAFCVVKIDGQDVGRTGVIWNSKNPEWNEDFIL
jgi:hypothetical protein